MAAVAYAPATGSLRIHLADGSRQPLPDDFQTFLRMVEGHKPVASAFVNGSSAVFPGLPFSDNSRQRYTVFAHARYHRDALVPVGTQGGSQEVGIVGPTHVEDSRAGEVPR